MVVKHRRLQPPIAHNGPMRVPAASVGPIEIDEFLGHNISTGGKEHTQKVLDWLKGEGYRIRGEVTTTDALVKLRDAVRGDVIIVQIHEFAPKQYAELLEESKKGFMYTGESRRHIVLTKQREAR